MAEDPRLTLALILVERLTAGEYHARCAQTGGTDDLDMLLEGLNNLAAELEGVGAREDRLGQIQAFMVGMASGDPGPPLEPTARGDSLDAVMEGLNMLAEELQQAVRLQAKFRDKALYDDLMGLATRDLMVDRLRRQMARADREGKKVALLFVDLNGFKPINDRHGHEVGDAVLREVGKRLMAATREDDTVARHGGDEFVVVGGVNHRAGGTRMAEKLATELNRAWLPPLQSHRVSASIGVAIYPEDGRTTEELLHHADLEMYKHKTPGATRERRRREGPVKVLLVDDDTALLSSVGRHLRRRYEVRLASDGEEGFGIAQEWRPDVVVSDERMPKVRGTKLLTQVKNLLPTTVRILVTGNEDLFTLTESINSAQIYRYFRKPVDIEKLVEVIDSAIDTAA